MSATDWVIASLTILFVLGVGAALVVLATMVRTQRELAATVDALRVETAARLEAMTVEITNAGYQIDRIDGLLDAANSVEHTLDSASKLAFRTVSNPVVKAMALGTGTKRAVQRMRGAPPEVRVPEPTGTRRRGRRKEG